MKDTEINGYRILSMFNMFKEMKATKRTKEEKNHQADLKKKQQNL